MKILQDSIRYSTQGRGSYDITRPINEYIADADIKTGICNLFLKHTSASLILCENADSTVRQDLESFMARLVQDGDPMFKHDYEGADDMAAHIRSILTHNDLNLPIRGGRLDLGTWQGIYLWEHRYHHHHREIGITLMGQ